MSSIQSRFEVAVPELPDHIDPASYSKFWTLNYLSVSHASFSDILGICKITISSFVYFDSQE